MTKYYLLLASLSILGLSGCTSPTGMVTPPQSQSVSTSYEKPTPHKLALYQQTMRSVASGIKHDSNYRRITLDTPEKKEWFRMLTYRLWDRQITRNQFMAEGLAQYPTHKYEFEFVIKGFESVCG
jgi:hypothetical protein